MFRKICFYISLSIVFLHSYASAQDTWLLDSLSILSLTNGEINEPYFASYRYNLDSEIMNIQSTLSETTFAYGSNEYEQIRISNNGQKQVFFYRFDLKGRRIEYKHKYYDANSIVISNIERFSFYENDLLVRQIRYNNDFEEIYEYTYEDNLNVQLDVFEEGVLTRRVKNKYTSSGQLEEIFENRFTQNSYRKSIFTYDTNGRKVKDVITDVSSFGEHEQINCYSYSDQVDSILRIEHEDGDFFRGSLEVTYSENGDSIQDRYTLYAPHVDSSRIDTRRVLTPFQSPQGILWNQERYSFIDTTSLLEQSKRFQINELADDHYQLVEINDNFNELGQRTFLSTEISDFRKLDIEETTLYSDDEISISPNPVFRNEAVYITIKSGIKARLFIYNSQGQKVQSLNVGSKEVIRWTTPRVSGIYYAVFIDEQGNRSMPKAIQVN